MRKFTPLFWTFSLLLWLATACSPKATPDPSLSIQQAVAGTLAAIPTATPIPTFTPYPTPTPVSLAGLFCEYQFCIGHPPEMSFFDKMSFDNPLSPSNYSSGYIAAYNGNSVFIQMIWQFASGTSDPRFLLDTIIDKRVDTPSGDTEVKLLHNMNLEYTAITSTAADALPFGGAAAWICGDRAFAWKAYTPQAEAAKPLFENAISRFMCEQK